MAKKATSESFSDSFWSNSSQYGLFASSSSSSFNKKKETVSMQEFLHAVDETPDFHDPYSDLSLFLSEKIKKEMQECGSPKKWSLKVQEELIQKITPEFQKKFPHYRLGVAALKKIWEKIVSYTQQIQGKTEAIGPDGKLNVNFFIKENLKQYFQQKAASFLNPYHYAHQVASKMSECIAIMDGIKPKLDVLTHTIWSIQKHLLNAYPLQQYKSPYDEFDKIDKLIVKTVLETTAKEPHIGLNELEHKTKESLQALHDLPDFSSLDKVTCNVSAILSEKLYATSPFHILFFAEQKQAICNFIRKHSSLYKSVTAGPQLSDLVRRIIALYTLASQLPKNLDDATLTEAITASYTSSCPKPSLSQAVYAFISAELMLMKDQKSCYSIEYTTKTILQAYKETLHLPALNGKEKEVLEIVIWKILSETEGFLEKLPYRIGQRMEEEIAHILIDNPSKSFSSIVHDTVQFFKRTKELTETKKWIEIDKKIHIWCVQGDMLCRSIRLDLETPLAKIIQEKWSRKQIVHSSHSAFVSEVCQEFLKKHPGLTIYMAQLSSRAWTLYKYMWFTCFSQPQESSYDRFLKWHIVFFKERASCGDSIIHQLEEVCKKCLPLMPFDAQHCQQMLSSFEEEKYA
jgi:hypothetical protein